MEGAINVIFDLSMNLSTTSIQRFSNID